MIDKKIEERLKNLRELYLDKRHDSPSDSTIKELEGFTSLTLDEKEQKLLKHLHFLAEKLTSLNDQLELLREKNANRNEITELLQYISAVKTKKNLLEQKLEFLQSGESLAARKERVKRQLTDLELKRCRAILSKKDCAKIDEKIASKKESIRRLK
jgi:hypothetical protein